MKKILGFAAFIVIMLIFVLNNTTTISSYVEEDGFVMPESKIDEYMIDITYNDADDFDLVEIDEFDYIYEKSSSYYTEEGTQIDLSYPAIIRDGNALKFIDGGAYLISDEFEFAATVDGTTIASQTCFNMDGGVVDDNTYIFAQLRNGLFVATTDFVIETQLEEFTISKNAIVYFDDEFINVYNYEDGSYEFLAIRGLQDTTITYGDVTYQYSDFYDDLYQVAELVKQEIEEEEEKVEEVKDKISAEDPEDTAKKVADAVEAPESPPEVEQKEPEESVEAEIEVESEPAEPEEIQYVKPEVEVSDVSAWVYSINGELDIYDPAGRISGSVTFYVYDESGTLILRDTTKKSGTFSLATLPPDSTLAVEAYYTYYNEYNMKITEQCLELTTVTTLPFDEEYIYDVSLTFDESETIYTESMGVTGMMIENTSDYDEDDSSLENFYLDMLPYVYSMNFVFENEETGEIITSKVATSTVSSLRSASILDYVTSSDLEPDTTYTYYVEAFDRYGNEFTLVPDNSGEYTTSKEAPSVKLSVKSRATDEVVLQIALTDTYSALTEDTFTLVIMYGEEILELDYKLSDFEGSGELEVIVPVSSSTLSLSIYNLPYSVTLQAYAYGNYNLNDGLGDQTDQQIGYLSFYSAGIPSGSITFNNSFVDIAGTTVTTEISLSQNSTTDLVALMTDFTLNYETDGQSLSYTITKDLLNSINIESNYNDELGALIVQIGDEKTLTPEILLYATKDILEEYGAWQTFINSALYGSSSSASGKLSVELAQGTLLAASVYSFDIDTVADLGTNTFDVTTYVQDEEFTTLKQEPIIYYEDYFIASDFIEFYNLEVSDIYEVITDGVYSIQLYEDGVLVNAATLNTSTIEETLRFEMLTEGHTYTFVFVATEYNLTFEDDLSESQYEMKELTFEYEEGLQSSIELSNMSYSYTGIDTSGDYGYVGTNSEINMAYNTTTNEVEYAEGYFTTDYLEYNCNSTYYSTFKDFADYGETVTFSFYKYENGEYVVVAEMTYSTRSWLISFSEYANSTQFKYTTAEYVRITGSLGNINSAYYYQYTNEDLEVFMDISEDDSVFIRDIQVGTTSSDLTSVTYSSTDYFEVTAGELLEVKQSSDYVRIYYYDENYDYVGSSDAQYYTQTATLEVPSNAAYARAMIKTSILETTGAVFQLARISGVDEITSQATIHWTLEDDRDDAFFLINEYNDDSGYTITKYQTEISPDQEYSEDDIAYEHLETIEYDGVGNIDVDLYQTETVDSDMAYKYEISIEYHGRTVVLDEVTFVTDSTIKFIDSISDFEEIEYNKYATYYVTCDIREDEGTNTNYIYFGGTLDFQGYSITLTRSGTTNEALFQDLYVGGEIKNVEIIIEDGDVCRTFLNTNYGTLSNIKYTINKSIDSPVLSNLIDNNASTGVIDNFIIEFNGDTLFYNESEGEDSAVFVRYNSGTITNGYIYNTVEGAGVYLHDNAGVLTYTSTSTSSISNVYALCDIYSNFNQAPSGESWYSAVISVDGEGRFTNIFGLSTRYEFYYDAIAGVITYGYTNTSQEPLFSSLSGSVHYDDSFENVYLLSEVETYDVLYSEYFESGNLHDTEWYDYSLGEDSNFIVDDMVNQGFYPILDLDSSMMDKQVYIELPELETTTRPDYLYSTLVGETQEYTTVELVFNNSSYASITAVSVEGLTATVTNQSLRDDLYIVTIQLSNPSEYYDEYTFESFTYRSGTTSITAEINETIIAPFYYSIDEIADFAMMETKTKWNYRLTSDFDFEDYNGSNWNSEIYVSNTFYGKLDGGIYDAYGIYTGMNYTLKNINLTQSQFSGNALLFNNITYGEMSNINFENISWVKETSAYVGIVYVSYYSTLDNIHIDGVSFTSSTRGATLASIIYGSTVTNCSASDVYLTNGTSTSGYYAGGLIGYASYSDISTCFVQDFVIETSGLDLSNSMSAGGLVGMIGTTGDIDSCYTVGYIYNPSYNGGVVGSGVARITNCYTNVTIVADGDFNGGISGGTSSAYTIDCLVLGDIIIMQESPTYTHLLSATDTWYYSTNNYGYEGQTVNSVAPGLDYTDGILTYDQLMSSDTYLNTIGMGTAYDYSEVEEAILPKLYDSDGNLLDNQVDNYLNSGDVYMTVTGRSYSSSYETTIYIEHEGYTVGEVRIDGMNETTTQNNDTSKANTSSYVISSTLENAYDLYIVTATLVSEIDGTTIDLISTVDYGDPVYWTISNIGEWQEVMAKNGTTNENIMITGKVDFSGYDSEIVLANLSLNRLDGLGTDVSILSGIDINDNTDDNLIATIYASFSDIAIVDSTIDIDSTSYQYTVGFIGVVQGQSDNLYFSNNKIEVANVGTTTVGIISKAYGLISNVDMSYITVDVATSGAYRTVYTGSLVGYTTSGIQNVSAYDITVSSYNGEQVGGIVGRIYKTDTALVDLSNISVDKVTVKGSSYVGGIIGYSYNCSNISITATNVEVDGTYALDTLSNDMVELGYYVGGVAGYTSTTINNSEIDGYSFENIKVTGQYRVGGVVGTGTLSYADIRNVVVTGVRMVGGVGGYVSSETYNVNIYNADVTATDNYAGAIGGRTYQIFYCYAFDCDITAGSYAGGLIGFIGNYTYSGDIISQTWAALYYSGVLDSIVTTTSGSHAGGLAGYIYSYGSSITRSYVSDTIITSKTGYAGGLVGEISLECVYYSYVTGGSVTSETGSYTGGLIGMVNHKIENENENYAGHFYRCYSDTTVSGKDYVGGIFGCYRSDYSSPDSTSYRQMYSLTNYSDLTGTSNVYGVGYIEVLDSGEDSSDYISSSYFDALVSYDGVTINGSPITSSQVSNNTDSSKFYLVSLKDVSSYSLLNTSLANGGLSSTTTYFYSYLANTGSLNSFDIFIDSVIETSTKTFTLNLENINLEDGNYKISIGSSSSSTTGYANLVDIAVKDGKASYTVSISSTSTSKTLTYDFYVTLSDANNEKLYASFYDNYYANYTFLEVTLTGDTAGTVSDANYYYSSSNEEITLLVDTSSSLSWYRLYDGMGYVSTSIQVTSMSDGNSLTTDIPGIYYAVNTSTYERSELFVYETNLYTPMISLSSTTLYPYQSGYSVTDSGITSTYSGNLVLNGTVLGMISRDDIDSSTISASTNSLFSMLAINMLGATSQEVLEIPDYEVYASGVGSINVEFDDTISYSEDSLGYTILLSSGDTSYEYDITSRVMTFEYDFSEDLTITITSADDQEETTNYEVEELQSLVSVYENDYYYQSVNGVTNAKGETITGDFVNVYDYYAIDDQGVIYNLADQVIEGTVSDNLELCDSIPLYVSQYVNDDSTSILYTYATFTYNVTSDISIEEIIFVKNGEVYAFSGSTNKVNNAFVADSYGDESYQAYVNGSGDFIDITAQINVPDSIELEDIVEISDTFDSDIHIVLVRYSYGQIKAFNYATGEEIELEESATIDVLSYAYGLISGLFDGDSDSQTDNSEAYEDSQNMEDAIEGASQSDIDAIQSDSTSGTSGSSSGGTVSIYNEEVLSFETYFIAELISTASEEVTSVQEKIEVASEAGYQGTLNNLVVTTSYVSEAKDNTVNIVIFAVLSVSVGGLLVYLKKSNKEKDIL